MRILFVLPRIPLPAQDGGSVVMVQTIQSLIQRGHAVDVAALDTTRHPGSYQQLAELARDVRVQSVDTQLHAMSAVRSALRPRFPAAFNLTEPASYWVARFASPQLLNTIVDMVRQTPYDVIVCESLFTACYGMAITKILGEHSPPWVLHAHNVEHVIQDRLAADPLRSAPQRWYRKFLAWQTLVFERAVARSAHGIVALSEVDAQWFSSQRSAGANLVTCVWPGVRIPDRAGELRQPNTLGFLGAMDWAPNVDGILWFVSNVLPIVRDTIPDVVFNVAGRGRSSVVEELHNGTSIVVHGKVEDAATFMQSNAVNVVPLHSGSGIRIKIIEALAGACAVVSTPTGCEGLNVQNGEHLLVADNKESFAAACIALLQNEVYATQLGDRGRGMVQRDYSWNVSGARLEKALGEVTSASR